MAEHGFPFVNGAVLGSAVLGAVIIARYERHRGRLAAQPDRFHRGLLAADRGLRDLGRGRGRAGLEESRRSVGVALGAGRRPARDRRPRVDVPAGTGWSVPLPALAERRSSAGRRGAVVHAVGAHLEPDDVRPPEPGRRSGPRTAPLARLPPDRRRTGRVGRLHGGPAEEEPGRDSPAGSADRPVRCRWWPSASRASSWSRAPTVARQTWAASLPLFVAYLLIPVLFAIAVLRYRLYDIEVIVNRTVVVAVGTAFAGLGYTTLVVTVGKDGGPPDERLLAVAAGDRPGRPGVPAASPLGGPSREPVGLRLPGPALRSAVGLQRPPRRDAVPGDPAAGRGRRGRAGRVGTPGRGEPRGAGRADAVGGLGPGRRRGHRPARGRGTHRGHPAGHHRGVDPQGTPTAAVRHPAPDGDLRPGGGRLPQRGDGEPAGGTRGRARPHHA